MRKIFAILLAATMVFSLASCGSSATDYGTVEDLASTAEAVSSSSEPVAVEDADASNEAEDVYEVENVEADEEDNGAKGDTTVEEVNETENNTNEVETVYALDPDAFFGTEGEQTDDGLKYYTDDSHELADVYAFEVLCDEYSFSFLSMNSDTDCLVWELGYGDSTSDPIIWVYAYDNLIMVDWNEDVVQWITPKGYETTVDLSYEDAEVEVGDVAEVEMLEEETTTSAALPPTMDDAYSFLTLESDDGYDDNGNAYLTYSGCENTDDTIATIEDYIEILEDYGYSLLYSEKRASSYYVYYLECSDAGIEEFTYRSQECQLALEGFANDSYGWHTIYVYYSPSIVASYRSVDNASGGSSSGSTSSNSSSSSSTSSGVTVKCTKCHGSGEITCTNCNGMGHKETYVTVPNYSGHSSTSTGTSKQTCYKCGGSGTITCTRCGGSGTE